MKRIIFYLNSFHLFIVHLKSKKPTAAPVLHPIYTPKKHVTPNTAIHLEQSTTTHRPAYKHKTIDRQNLKLLFPSLQVKQTTTTTTTAATTSVEPSIDVNATAINESNTENDSTTPIVQNNTRNAYPKYVSGVKFSSKLRSSDSNHQIVPNFRTHSTTAINLHTSKLPAQHRTSTVSKIKNKQTKWEKLHFYSSNCNFYHLFNNVQSQAIDSTKFSARYKSGDSGSSLAAYRKNLLREKPPFYTPTTPPITTQVVCFSIFIHFVSLL